MANPLSRTSARRAPEKVAAGHRWLACGTAAALPACGGGSGNSGYAISGTVNGLAAGSKVTLTNASDSLAVTGSGPPAGPGKAGAQPEAGLIQATDGNFYGTTMRGGTNDTGTVFQLSASGTVSTIHSFGPASGTDGTAPLTALLQASDGSLCRTTSSGGAYQSGSTAPLGTVSKIE